MKVDATIYLTYEADTEQEAVSLVEKIKDEINANHDVHAWLGDLEEAEDQTAHTEKGEER